VESTMEDFDNDGFVDLLIAGSSNRYFHNNGNKTFTKIEGLFNTNDMLSFATGDLNHDGLIDLYTSYGDAYNNPSNIDDVLWMNNTRNNNHFITINLLGTISNKGAIGARALIYGAWGTQIREVRAGDNYGTTNTAMLHFGLGTSTTIDSIVVKFPSGITTTVINPQVDQFMTIIENDCVSPVASVTYSLADNVICTGTTETLTATTAGLSYLWNDGSTLQTLNITAGGEYNVEVSAAGNNCKAISPTFIIEQDPDQTPVITATGETEFCNGSSVTLQSQTYGASSFTWSNGDFTPFTSITQTGVYTLTIQGFCAQFTSTPISVTVHVVPDPTTNEKYNAGTFNTGLFVPSGNTQFSANTTNARMFFDVIKPCTLKTAKVYTDTPGLRRIELRNSADSLLQFLDVTIAPDSQIITLDFILSPGTDYYLTTDAAFNQAIPGWGNISPRLKRNSVGVSYPYSIPDAINLTGNNFGGQYYYYFYDISVEKTGLTCTSNKVQVTVDISTTGLQSIDASGIQLFPNPANEILNIHLQQPGEVLVNLYDATGRRVSNNTFTNLQIRYRYQDYNRESIRLS
ncbi:MAG: CRTAC1 family protein, partial [Bacteroidetes bacterium]|nr:CRTAC1 family protein [Bacteroidota bacterium]